MDYVELPLPPALDGLVAAIWTIDADGGASDWIDHDATPDGCIELIHRMHGRSIWGSEQPAMFAAGLNLAPVRFRVSGDARFLGIRLWPWAWEILGGAPCPAFADDWIPIATNSSIAALLRDPVAALGEVFAKAPPHSLGPAILAATSVADIVATSGCSHRMVQRWFERVIGITPRAYLRLIRFRRTMADFAEPAATLSDQAAKSGFADHAHMARDFRLLAGTPPGAARASAKGPFLPGDNRRRPRP
jgi:AraC-like DNA-binding protein